MKSISTLPEVRAPAISGPRMSMPTRLSRAVRLYSLSAPPAGSLSTHWAKLPLNMPGGIPGAVPFDVAIQLHPELGADRRLLRLGGRRGRRLDRRGRRSRRSGGGRVGRPGRGGGEHLLDFRHGGLEQLKPGLQLGVLLPQSFHLLPAIFRPRGTGQEHQTRKHHEKGLLHPVTSKLIAKQRKIPSLHPHFNRFRRRREAGVVLPAKIAGRRSPPQADRGHPDCRENLREPEAPSDRSDGRKSDRTAREAGPSATGILCLWSSSNPSGGGLPDPAQSAGSRWSGTLLRRRP